MHMYEDRCNYSLSTAACAQKWQNTTEWCGEGLGCRSMLLHEED